MAQQLPYEQNAFRAVHADGAPQAPATPWNQLMEQAIHGAVSALDRAATDAVQLEDFSAGQQADYHLNLIREQADTALQQRLSLPDGDDESFYEANGVLRKNKVMDFLSFYRKGADRLAGLGVTPQTREQIFWKTQNTLMGVVDNLTRRGVEKQKQLAMKSLEDNYNLALSQNRWEDAAQIAQGGVDAGLYAPGRGTLMGWEARKKGVLSSYQELLFNDPNAAGRMLASGDLDAFFTPNERFAMRKEIQKRGEELAKKAMAENTLPHWVLDENTPVGRAMKKARKTPELTGRFTQNEISWHTQLMAGQNVDQARKEILSQMLLEAQSFDPEQDPEKARDEFLTRYRQFCSNGKQLFKDEDIIRIYKNGRKAYDEASSLDIGAGKIIDNLKDSGQLVNESGWSQTASKLYDAQELSPGGGLYIQYKDLLQLKKGEAMDDIRLKVAQQEKRRHLNANAAEIQRRYALWRATDEGKRASSPEQASHLQQFIQDVTGRNITLGSTKFRYDYKILKDKQKKSYENFTNTHRRDLDFPTLSHPLTTPTPCGAGYADPDDDLADDEILLPKSMMGGVKPGETVVQLQYNNGHVRAFRVKGECDGDTLLQSHRLGEEGFNIQKIQPVKLSVLTPAAGTALMDIQTQVLKYGRERVMGNMLIGSEARRDRFGRLIVYTPPDGDGGGAFEVAGINAASHPEEARKLRDLIAAGRYDEAEREANRYIVRYTNPVASLVKASGLSRADGVEYFLRDIYFNGGPGGFNKVLNRALDLPDHAARERQLESLKQYSGDARRLLDRLNRERQAWYEGIARNNPQKRQFLQGWRNRTAKTYGQARQLS